MNTTSGDGTQPPTQGGRLALALRLLRARADELRARGILAVWIFGSVARGEDGPDSDLDLVVEVSSGVGTFDIMDIEELLAAEYGRPVQIISRDGIHPVRHAEILRDMTAAF